MRSTQEPSLYDFYPFEISPEAQPGPSPLQLSRMAFLQTLPLVSNLDQTESPDLSRAAAHDQYINALIDSCGTHIDLLLRDAKTINLYETADVAGRSEPLVNILGSVVAGIIMREQSERLSAYSTQLSYEEIMSCIRYDDNFEALKIEIFGYFEQTSFLNDSSFVNRNQINEMLVEVVRDRVLTRQTTHEILQLQLIATQRKGDELEYPKQSRRSLIAQFLASTSLFKR